MHKDGTHVAAVYRWVNFLAKSPLLFFDAFLRAAVSVCSTIPTL